MGEFFLGVALALVFTLIIIFARKAKLQYLKGAENVIEGTKKFVEGTSWYDKYGDILDIALTLVEGAEQLKKTGQIDNKEAKAKVKESLKQIMEDLGKDVPDNVLDLIIESAVFMVNFFVKEKQNQQ